MKCNLNGRCADFDDADHSCHCEDIAKRHCSYRLTGEFPDKLHPNKYTLAKIPSNVKEDSRASADPSKTVTKNGNLKRQAVANKKTE